MHKLISRCGKRAASIGTSTGHKARLVCLPANAMAKRDGSVREIHHSWGLSIFTTTAMVVGTSCTYRRSANHPKSAAMFGANLISSELLRPAPKRRADGIVNCLGRLTERRTPSKIPFADQSSATRSSRTASSFTPASSSSPHVPLSLTSVAIRERWRPFDIVLCLLSPLAIAVVRHRTLGDKYRKAHFLGHVVSRNAETLIRNLTLLFEPRTMGGLTAGKFWPRNNRIEKMGLGLGLANGEVTVQQ